MAGVEFPAPISGACRRVVPQPASAAPRTAGKMSRNARVFIAFTEIENPFEVTAPSPTIRQMARRLGRCFDVIITSKSITWRASREGKKRVASVPSNSLRAGSSNGQGAGLKLATGDGSVRAGACPTGGVEMAPSFTPHWLGWDEGYTLPDEGDLSWTFRVLD